MEPFCLFATSSSMYVSVCPSSRPSVHHTFFTCSNHRIIMKFSGVITIGRSDVHAKGRSQSIKVKNTEVKTQASHFWTVTPAWIHIWQWKGTLSLMRHRRGALLFFKVIRQISRCHWTKICWLWPELGVSRPQLQFQFTDGSTIMYKAWSGIEEVS